jgi:hypothetical protein
MMRLSHSRWVRWLANCDLFGLLLIVLGVLLLATVAGEQATWLGWLLGAIALLVTVGLVLGRQWSRRPEPTAIAEHVGRCGCGMPYRAHGVLPPGLEDVTPAPSAGVDHDREVR